MKIDKVKFKKDVFEAIFDSNYNKCAKDLGVEPPQLHRFLNTDSQAGPKLLGKFCLFCERNGINFRDYIFLPEPSTAVYKNAFQYKISS